MSEKSNTGTEKEPASTAKQTMAGMCERMMSHFGSMFGSKGFSPASCCSSGEPAAPDSCAEPATEGTAS